MKLSALTTAAALALFSLAAAPLPAHANAELAQKHICTACHAVERKIVGPAFAEVAKKYAGQKDAAATLADSIRKGGSGKWGAVPMPPQPGLSEDELKTLAAWILGGAK